MTDSKPLEKLSPTNDFRIEGHESSSSRLSVEDQIAAWGIKLDDFLRQAETSVRLGRELVEQRALNLDLQRQVHRLEEQVRSLRLTNGSVKSAPPSMGTLTDMSEPASSRSSDSSPLRQFFSRLSRS
ncbi:MAG TPA: hypothetical protein VNX29_14890 [Kaistia sp.]|nr:hypothetical protein [Kaistia sp.]